MTEENLKKLRNNFRVYYQGIKNSYKSRLVGDIAKELGIPVAEIKLG